MRAERGEAARMFRGIEIGDRFRAGWDGTAVTARPTYVRLSVFFGSVHVSCEWTAGKARDVASALAEAADATDAGMIEAAGIAARFDQVGAL